MKRNDIDDTTTNIKKVCRTDIRRYFVVEATKAEDKVRVAMTRQETTTTMDSLYLVTVESSSSSSVEKASTAEVNIDENKIPDPASATSSSSSASSTSSSLPSSSSEKKDENISAEQLELMKRYHELLCKPESVEKFNDLAEIVTKLEVLPPMYKAVREKRKHKLKEELSYLSVYINRRSELWFSKKTPEEINKIKFPKNTRFNSVTKHFEKICPCCQKWKEKTPTNFQENSSSDNLATCKPGFESLRGSKSYPCLACYNNVRFQIVRNYKKEDKNWSVEEVTEMVNRQGGKCPISGAVFSEDSSNPDNFVNLCRKNNDKKHTIANCFLGIAECNPNQHDAIPCLFETYKEIYTTNLKLADGKITLTTDEDDAKRVAEFTQNWSQNPIQNGVTADCVIDLQAYDKQLKDKHLPAIIGAVNQHLTNDIEAGRLSTSMMKVSRKKYVQNAKAAAFKLLIAKKCLCNVSGFPLTIDNGPFRFSFDRNDDSLPHFGLDGTDVTNLNVRGRIFNTSRKMTRKKLLGYTLTQTLTERSYPITDHHRYVITQMINEL